MLPSFMIVDNFLRDPLAVRRMALALDYDPAFKQGNYPGLLSTRPLPIEGLDQAVSKLIGAPVGPQPGTSHCHCRLTLAREKGLSGVHIDPCFYSGHPLPQPARTLPGRHRILPAQKDRARSRPRRPAGMMRAGYDDPNALIEEVVNKDTLKPARWERSFVAPMRFNRLILFSPWMFHNSGPGFGTGPDNGRLVHLMFFAAAAA